MSITIKGEVVIAIGKGNCFIAEGEYHGKRGLGFGRRNDDEPSVVITFENEEAIKNFLSDITEMMKDTGA